MKPMKLMMRVVLMLAFVVYLYLLIKLILFKLGPVSISSLFYQLQRTLQNPEMIFNRQGNYTPFKEISRGIQSMSIYDPFSMTNVVGNILAFIPFGIFIPMIFRQKGASFIGVFVLSLLLSLCFEVTQLVLYIGTFDVDDLILNTSGGIIGYGVFRIGIYLSTLRIHNKKVT